MSFKPSAQFIAIEKRIKARRDAEQIFALAEDEARGVEDCDRFWQTLAELVAEKAGLHLSGKPFTERTTEPLAQNQRTGSGKIVEVAGGTILKETDKAYLIWCGQDVGQEWFPKSEVTLFGRWPGNRFFDSMELPEWLAIEKGIDYQET